MIREEELAIVRDIDNRVRELELLDLMQIGSYNVNMSIFSSNNYGRINIIKDLGDILEIELCDISGNVLGTIKTPRKNVIRSIINYEFSADELKLYDAYLGYKMSSSLEKIGSSIDTIQGLYNKKSQYRKDLFSLESKIKEYELGIDYDYCLVGSESLFTLITKTKEGIRKEYINEGIEAASVNDNIERLEREILGKMRHKRKISKLRGERREASSIRKDNIEIKGIQLEDHIIKYKEDLKERCLRVLKSMKVLGMARVSYSELTGKLNDDNLSLVMRDTNITAEEIYDYFITNIIGDEIVEPAQFFTIFKKYILGYLFNKKGFLEAGLSNVDLEIQDEFHKQRAIITEFIPHSKFSIEDRETYNRMHK